MSERIGDRSIGKYQLIASLGRGGMADVFLAVARGPRGFNKLTVVKCLREGFGDEVDFSTMFLDEARLAARLSHPNIVHTYEVGEHNGAYFIAMEYLEGQALNSILKEAVRRRERFPLPMCARIIADALAGLHHAHTIRDYDGTPLNIIHRDVSPHNVFVTYDGQVKLVDFGIAKAALSSTQTAVGVLKGKAAYMSPEQASGGQIDRRVDIFAMGIVLWELVTCKRLMATESTSTTLNRLLNEPVRRISSVDPSVDEELDRICARALEKDPKDRYQSAEEMREALEGYIARGARNFRPEEVGKRISEMFDSVRADVKRQVRAQMAAIGELSPPPPESSSVIGAYTVEGMKKKHLLPLFGGLFGAGLLIGLGGAFVLRPRAENSSLLGTTGESVLSATGILQSGTVEIDARPGFLSLDTTPPTRVLDGTRVLGTTPLDHVALSPGEHSLSLENSSKGIRQIFSVNISRGETVARRITLK